MKLTKIEKKALIKVLEIEIGYADSLLKGFRSINLASKKDKELPAILRRVLKKVI